LRPPRYRRPPFRASPACDASGDVSRRGRGTIARLGTGHGEASGVIAAALPRPGVRDVGVPRIFRAGDADPGDLRVEDRLPARRTASHSIADLRAIPWVFSWMQSRHTLPGWYGLGSAIQDYLAEGPGGMETLRAMHERWPFWATALSNVQMILSKADLTIARLYADLLKDQEQSGRIFGRIKEEHALTVRLVCEVTGQATLLERTPVLQKSIQQRNPYVDPLSIIQTVLLRRLREGGTEPELRAGVLESINGIAAGLKNTG